MEVERKAKERLIFYYIERPDTQEWFFIDSKWDIGTYYRAGKYEYTDSWTNDPMKAMRWESKEEPEKYLQRGRESFKGLNCFVTEHEFINLPEEPEPDLGVFKESKTGETLMGNTTGNQMMRKDNDYHGGYSE